MEVRGKFPIISVDIIKLQRQPEWAGNQRKRLPCPHLRGELLHRVPIRRIPRRPRMPTRSGLPSAISLGPPGPSPTNGLVQIYTPIPTLPVRYRRRSARPAPALAAGLVRPHSCRRQRPALISCDRRRHPARIPAPASSSGRPPRRSSRPGRRSRRPAARSRFGVPDLLRRLSDQSATKLPSNPANKRNIYVL
jgi:hypothetical protein